MKIHPTAVINPKARLDKGVIVGPYSVINADVTIGRDTVIDSHVVIDGKTSIGERNHIHSFASIGSPPQDTGYKGEDTRVIIGNDNIIREYVSINRATTKEDWETVVGSDNFIMAYAHIAHDCVLGNRIIMSNVATLGGHTTVGDYANLGGLMAAHQFVRIGEYAFIGGKTAVPKDIPPFMLVAGAEGGRAKLFGINQKGLQRQGFSDSTIKSLKKAYSIIWRKEKILSEGIKRVEQEIEAFPELDTLLGFLKESRRGITR